MPVLDRIRCVFGVFCLVFLKNVDGSASFHQGLDLCFHFKELCADVGKMIVRSDNRFGLKLASLYALFRTWSLFICRTPSSSGVLRGMSEVASVSCRRVSVTVKFSVPVF